MDWLLNLLTAPWRWLQRLARGFMAMSLAARLAWAAAGFLAFIVLLTLVALLLSGGSGWTTLQSWWSPGKGLVVILLVLIVSVLVYYAARLWMQQESRPLPRYRRGLGSCPDRDGSAADRPEEFAAVSRAGLRRP